MESGTESVRELSVEGVDVPEDAELDEGVIVAVWSRDTNFPLTLGWSLQEVLGTRVFFMGAGDGVLDKTLEIC